MEHIPAESDFVGGVTDGQSGMTAMLLNRDGVHAHKSWVITDQFVLCLGAAITTDSTLSLATSIDQRNKRDELSYLKDQRWMPVDGAFMAFGKALRFYHDSTGYILLQPANSVAISEKRSGRWSDFMGSYTPQIVEGEVVSLYIRHPQGAPASYQYLILPAASALQTANFRTDDIRVLRNEEGMQAVEAGGRFYITAYQTGNIILSTDLALEIHTPGIYMLCRHKDGTISVEASDPTHSQSFMSLKINDKGLKISLPDNHVSEQGTLN